MMTCASISRFLGQRNRGKWSHMLSAVRPKVKWSRFRPVARSLIPFRLGQWHLHQTIRDWEREPKRNGEHVFMEHVEWWIAVCGERYIQRRCTLARELVTISDKYIDEFIGIWQRSQTDAIATNFYNRFPTIEPPSEINSNKFRMNDSINRTTHLFRHRKWWTPENASAATEFPSKFWWNKTDK